MNGKICLVTGATDGIGKVTVRELAQQGATVIAVGRDPAKIKKTIAEIGQTPGTLDFLTADLSSQAQVRTIAETVKSKYDRLHVLVNNAGAMIPEYCESADGIEMTFALNHLAYFLLTNLLLDLITASAPARIINVASDYHEKHTINFDELGHPLDYHGGWTSYGSSKLANILFTYELARRLNRTDVTVNAVHPGFVNTNFQNAAGLNFRGQLTPEEGADTQIWLATSDEVEGITGKYFVRRRETRSSNASYDEAVARRLWDASAQMVHLTD
ncbi:MAG: SDR family oxidoreductase [Chloroflexi bacterium]|nr:SDR family oxidoreductase [Chloroflexota bacterium]